jgi:hypothetical protein
MSNHERDSRTTRRCNIESIAYRDGFITRQIDTIKKNPQSTERFISLFGASLGECIVSTYKGTWVITDKRIFIEVNANGKLNIVPPFQKVAKRILNGEDDGLVVYFPDLLPLALAPQI